MRELTKMWAVSDSVAEAFYPPNKPVIQVIAVSDHGFLSLHHQKKPPFVEIRSSLHLLERIVCSGKCNEPVLFVGETGTGKTTLVQNLSMRIDQKLTNLSQQSDVADLLGGFKPMDAWFVCIPLYKEFENLFSNTFSVKKSAEIGKSGLLYIKSNAMNKNTLPDTKFFFTGKICFSFASNAMNKNTLPDTKFFFTGKICFSFAVINFCPVLVPYINIFQFVEGAFVTALRNGDWILLDEVNLAPPEERYLHKYLFDEYLMARGNTSSGDFLENYILIRNLARAVLIKRYPVLLQGPTSSGKTSLVQYLAAITSHEFVWINNHEHTDVQEYLGSYVTDASGKLVFHEGVLVKALNQLLDDNRELFVPELRETMPAQLDFMPFSTLNPPTLYGGHKMLSRAFRNRFVESHVDEIPEDELSTILNNWCKISESYVKIMVEVMKELKLHRQSSEVFAGKHGFITLIDLFWWADHFRTFGNSNEDLARDGYYLLAETFKDEGEKKVVQAVLAKHLQVKLLKDNLYHQNKQSLDLSEKGIKIQHIHNSSSGNCPYKNLRDNAFYWLAHLLIVLLIVLSVHHTLGKVHSSSDTEVKMPRSSVFGGDSRDDNQEIPSILRFMIAIRDGSKWQTLFMWQDGPLVQAMKDGDMFLVDEISLADDSVLEQLNNVLEPERKLAGPAAFFPIHYHYSCYRYHYL
ncbi:unnamed protein product, partial [Vitis vinifera]